MTIARKVVYNVFVSAFSKIVSTALALLAIGFITRYLGPEGFGKYTTALAFFALFMALADFGLNTVSAREISRKNADEKKIIGNVFTLRVSISLAMIIFGLGIVFFLPYEDDLKSAILLSLLAFFFSSSYTVLNGIFQKRLIMDRVALVEVLGKAIQFIFILGAVHWNLGLSAIIGAFVVFMIFNASFLFWWSHRFVSFSFQFDFQFWKKFLQQSLPLGLATILTFFYFKFDAILLSFLKGTEAVGIFGAAYKIIENATFFPAMIAGLILPLLAKHIGNDMVKFKHIADAMAKTFLLIAIPLFIGGFILAEDIILLIGGEDFLASVFVLQILLFSLTFMFFGNFFNTLLIVNNKQKLLVKLLFVCVVSNLSLNFLLIPKYSYVGVAISSAFTELLVVFLTGFAVYKTQNYLFPFGKIFRILFSGMIMAGAILIISPYTHFFITLPFAMGIYAISILLTRAVEKREWQEIFFREKGVKI